MLSIFTVEFLSRGSVRGFFIYNKVQKFEFYLGRYNQGLLLKSLNLAYIRKYVITTFYAFI